MNTRLNPRDLARDLVWRSACKVKMAAVISDSSGRIISYGWNHFGFDGMGMHAEAYAIIRANRKRLSGATITIAGKRNRGGKWLTSKPCEICMQLILASGIRSVEYWDGEIWVKV